MRDNENNIEKLLNMTSIFQVYPSIFDVEDEDNDDNSEEEDCIEE